MQPVPDCFINEFFGYRRSASFGSILRFYIRLDRTDDPCEVKFYNLYNRNETQWHVRGVGLFIDNILYILGHAVTADDKRSICMMMFALRQHGTTNNICGIVISMNREFPIAARVLLIPVGEHTFLSLWIDRTKLDDAAIQNIIVAKYGDQEAIETIMT